MRGTDLLDSVLGAVSEDSGSNGSKYRKWLCKTLSVKEADLGDAFKVEDAVTKTIEAGVDRGERTSTAERIFEYLKEWYKGDGEDSVIRQVVSGFVQAVGNLKKGTIFDTDLLEWIKWGKNLLKTMSESVVGEGVDFYSGKVQGRLKAMKDADAVVDEVSQRLEKFRADVFRKLEKAGFGELGSDDVSLFNGEIRVKTVGEDVPVALTDKEVAKAGIDMKKHTGMMREWQQAWAARDIAAKAYYDLYSR